GRPKCDAFITNKHKFSEKGQLWLSSVRSFLQQSLIPLLSNESSTCDAISAFAFNSHPSCYLKPINGVAICTLDPLVDWAALVELIGVKAMFELAVIRNEE
ncbi:hypothetical protein HDU99_001164, partial [Rhizoclosmatium hyalinum]